MHINKLSYALILIFFAGCAHIPTESPAAGLVREGTSLFNSGKLDEAAVLFRKAYSADPMFAPAYSMLGRVYLEKADSYRAEMFFRKALALDPSKAEIYGWIGDIYWAEGDTAGALEQYSKCPKGDPHYPILHFRIGMREYQNGRLPSAREEFNKALADPEYWGGHYGLGLIAFTEGNFTESSVLFHRAEHAGAEPNVKYWLAKSYRMQNRDQEAYFYFKQFSNTFGGECDLCPEADQTADDLKDAILAQPATIDTSLVIPFKVQNQDVLEVGVFDIDGNLIKSLFTGWITKGEYSLKWNGENADGKPAKNGVYIGCIERECDLQLMPMLLEKK